MIIKFLLTLIEEPYFFQLTASLSKKKYGKISLTQLLLSLQIILWIFYAPPLPPLLFPFLLLTAITTHTEWLTVLFYITLTSWAQLFLCSHFICLFIYFIGCSFINFYLDFLLGFLEKEINKDGIPMLNTGDNPEAPAPREMIDLEVINYQDVHTYIIHH